MKLFNQEPEQYHETALTELDISSIFGPFTIANAFWQVGKALEDGKIRAATAKEAETDEYHPTDEVGVLDMGAVNICGTPLCIAGHVAAVLGITRQSESYSFWTDLRWSGPEVKDLTSGRHPNDPALASRAIYRFLTEGRGDWDEDEDEDEGDWE